MTDKDYSNEPVGSSGVPHDVEIEVSDLITRLAERYQIKNGTTAAFFHVCATLSNHIGDGLQ